MQQSTIEKFRRTVGQRHDDLKGRLHELQNALVRPDDPGKKRCAQAALEACLALAALFHEEDLPKWFAKLREQITRVLKANSSQDIGAAAEGLIRFLFTFRDPIFNEPIADQPIATGVPDFEAAYTEEYKSSRLPELFDRLVVALEQVIASGEIDSNKAIKSLESLIALLKKHRNSTYSTSQWTWQFCSSAALNILWRYAEGSKVIGPIIKGIDDTMKDADVEWSKVREGAARKIQAAFPIDVSKIANEPPPPLGIGGPAPAIDAEFEVHPKESKANNNSPRHNQIANHSRPRGDAVGLFLCAGGVLGYSKRAAGDAAQQIHNETTTENAAINWCCAR